MSTILLSLNGLGHISHILRYCHARKLSELQSLFFLIGIGSIKNEEKRLKGKYV